MVDKGDTTSVSRLLSPRIAANSPARGGTTVPDAKCGKETLATLGTEVCKEYSEMPKEPPVRPFHMLLPIPLIFLITPLMVSHIPFHIFEVFFPNDPLGH